MPVHLRDIPDHDNRLTTLDADVDVNKGSLICINDIARPGQIVVVAGVDVVPAIQLRTVGRPEFVPELVSAVVGGDSPVVNAVDNIWRQHGQFRIRALDSPVHHPVLQGTAPGVSRGDPPRRYAAVVAEVAMPPPVIGTARLGRPTGFVIEPPHIAVTSKGVHRKATVCTLHPLQAEPAHGIRS